MQELLRFTTAGSVDDGKSTLIGRLLYDTKNIYEDQLLDVEKTSKNLSRETDLALLTDGLKSEREQGITIDVAYRYFSTPKRRFIIADTPGHEQYTRNMVTGASTANLAIILIDASKGVLTQSKRHSFIASLLGIPHIIVAINKMDLVNYDKNVYNNIIEEYTNFSNKLSTKDIIFIPISALKGDNVIYRSHLMNKWYNGPTILEHLENVHIRSDRNSVDFRFPVQSVNRPNSNFRGYCGVVESGTIRVGEDIIILPSAKESKIKNIIYNRNNIESANSPMSIIISLEDDIDISRGDMIVRPNNIPNINSKSIESIIIWMDDIAFKQGNTYRIKHTTNSLRCQFTNLEYRIDPNTLSRQKVTELRLNDIGRVSLEPFKPLMYDPYEQNRSTGSYIIIDEKSNKTVGAGIITNKSKYKSRKSTNIIEHKSSISNENREKLLNNNPKTIWFTGLSGSGKSTIAYATEEKLVSYKIPCYVLDGDNIRHGLCSDLGFSISDRSENIRRIAEVSKLMNNAGLTVIVSFISPYKEDREKAKEIIGDKYIEIFVDTPLEICESRDPKGLYKKARNNEISNFTGISDPYDEPIECDIHLKYPISIEKSVNCVIERLNILRSNNA